MRQDVVDGYHRGCFRDKDAPRRSLRDVFFRQFRIFVPDTMTTAHQIIALLKSHVVGDDNRFYSIAMQIAAHEARQGHGKLAKELRDLVDDAKSRTSAISRKPGSVPLAQPKGDLVNLLSVRYSDVRLNSMVLDNEMRERFKRILLELRQQDRLRSKGLRPRGKLLLLGPPGTGKTMTAEALAGELHLPLFTILLDGVITKFMGETAAKLRIVFDAMVATRGVYLFDEFDAIGSKRASGNDVGEIRRVLNSFLQFLENDESRGLIIAATNHPDLLDTALFRRFDDVIEYMLPDESVLKGIIEARLSSFRMGKVNWDKVSEVSSGLSQADIAKAADDSAKTCLLSSRKQIREIDLISAINERRSASRTSTIGDSR